MATVTDTEKRAARITDLYEWGKNRPDLFVIEGQGDSASLRLRSNHSISIKRGYCGFRDFAGGEGRAAKGNAIDFLMEHLGYTFIQAVKELTKPITPYACSLYDELPHITTSKAAFTLPEKADNQRRMFAYLCKTRGLSASVVQSLLAKGYIYQDLRGNVVFHSREDWAELHGTLTVGKAYHGIVGGSSPTGCWRFRVGDAPAAVYICEAAIDAISLALILGASAWYVSIGGAAKQGTIDRIKAGKLPAVIAVDNDEAGDACAARNSDLQRLVPRRKDWNEDLQDARIHEITVF